jgi:hypothetical protein
LKIKIKIFISSFLTTCGAGLKCLINCGLSYLYMGQTLAAIGQPFFLNAPAKIASTWFREDKVIISFLYREC